MVAMPDARVTSAKKAVRNTPRRFDPPTRTVTEMFFEKVGDQDTICALSTPPGVGGIAVIRVSGAKAATLAQKLCSFVPDPPASHRGYFGLL
ncbi:MAG: hypothetical protein AAB250_01360, partial [Bdellovibrionota bacterium]